MSNKEQLGQSEYASRHIGFMIAQIHEHATPFEYSQYLWQAPDTRSMSELFGYWHDIAERMLGAEELRDIIAVK